MGLFVGSGLCGLTLEAAGNIDGAGTSRGGLIQLARRASAASWGGQGAEMHAALTRSISRPRLLLVVSRSLGAEGGCAGARVG